MFYVGKNNFVIKLFLRVNVLLTIITSSIANENIHELLGYTDSSILEDSLEEPNEEEEQLSIDENSSTHSYAIEDIENESSSKKVVVQIFGFSVTPPKSMNLFGKISPNKQKPQKEIISIHQLSEKGDSGENGWLLNDEYEVNLPDYGEGYLHGDVEVELNEEDESSQRSVSANIYINEAKHQEDSHKDNNRNQFSSATKMNVFIKKLKSKLQDTGNPKQPPKYKKVVTRANRIGHLSPHNKEINVPNKEATTFENEYFVKKYRPGNRFINTNNSVRIFPYPLYYSAQPVVHQKKLVIPYPYLVLKSDDKMKDDPELEKLISNNINFAPTSKLYITEVPNVGFKRDDSNDHEVEVVLNDDLNVEPTSKLDPLIEHPEVNIHLADDYGLLEDEDYVPSTNDYDYDYYNDSTWPYPPGKTSPQMELSTKPLPHGPSTRNPHGGSGSDPEEDYDEKYPDEKTEDFKTKATSYPGKITTNYRRRSTTKYPHGRSTPKPGKPGSGSSGVAKTTPNGAKPDLPWGTYFPFDPFADFTLENETSTKYPNFYANGSLYDYYDCKALNHASFEPRQSISCVFIFACSMLMNVYTCH